MHGLKNLFCCMICICHCDISTRLFTSHLNENLFQVGRSWATLNVLRLDGLQKFFLKLFLLPCFFFLLWIFYKDAFRAPEETFQRTFVTRNGLIFISLAGAYCMAVVSTAATFVSVRTRYYQEAREGLYSGPTFLLSQMVANLPLSALTTALAAFITFRGLKDELVCWGEGDNAKCKLLSDYPPTQLRALQASEGPLHYENSYYPDFLLYWLALWGAYLLAEQQTISFLLVVKSSYTAASASLSLVLLYLVLGSATVRSLSSLPELVYHLTYIVQPRYSGAVLNKLEFHDKSSLVLLPWRNETTGDVFTCSKDNFNFGCRFVNGTHLLAQKYNYPGIDLDTMLDPWTNTAINFAFPGVVLLANMILYLVPLPAFVKAKFRE